jgi:sulfide:quinone oxidoreductase
VKITVVSPDTLGSELNDSELARTLTKALDSHRIEFLPDFPIERVTPRAALTSNGRAIDFDLLLLLPPFLGSAAAANIGITSDDGYINVDWAMRVIGQERIYAVGDCVNFSGPKMGHMAVRQGEVAATNLAAEIRGHEATSHYFHEIRSVIDEGGTDSIYMKKDLWLDEPASVKQGRFWHWAKLVQEKYWEAAHS